MMDRHQQAFTEEARELLGDLEEALLAVEHDPLNKDLVGRIFRAMHTIKGSSSMFGFEAIATFTHEIENAFDRVREGVVAVTPELITLTLASRDHIASLLVLAVSGGTPDETLLARGNALIQRLRALMPKSELQQGMSAAVPVQANDPGAAGNQGSVLFRIRFKPPENIYLRGLDPLNLIGELGGLGRSDSVVHTSEQGPRSGDDAERCRSEWDILLLTPRGEDAIRDVFIFVEEDSLVRIERLAETDAVDDNKWRALLESLRAAADASAATLRAIIREEQQHHDRVRAEASGAVAATHPDQHAIQSIKVPSSRLDKLVNLVGELVTVQARLSQAASVNSDPVIRQVAEEVESLVDELRDNTMSIRMLPIGSTFARFRRLVRDLSGTLGKEIDLVTEGEETELDKTVIERLADPMVHIIRNSIDHGIESPDLRERAGKSRTGTIRLSATHSGAHVHITIADDGKGLDRDAIRAKGIATGLLASDAQPTDQELFGLIFMPGFSTAQAVSNVSGRGVGMDVVRRSIEELRGTVDVASTRGTGTTITLKLPLTLAIIDGLLVEVCGDTFVLPLSVIKECVELPASVVRDNGAGQLINVRGEIVPYVRLRDFYGMEGTSAAIEYVVIADVEGTHVGFAVDAVLGEHQTVIKSLGTLYRNVKGVSGATLLGDGTIALIIDVPLVVSAAQQEREHLVKAHYTGIQTGTRH